jgi:hypothetical protein
LVEVVPCAQTQETWVRVKVRVKGLVKENDSLKACRWLVYGVDGGGEEEETRERDKRETRHMHLGSRGTRTGC